jgi:alkyl hydroperoxide reductase subunit AhpC
LQANLARFTELNTQVLGISVDSVYAHKAYAEKLGGLDFPLLADFHPKGKVAQAYGIWNAERGISYRTIILIDENGTVRHTQVYEKGLPDVDELLEIIKTIE